MKRLFVFKRMTAALLAVVILVSLLPVLSFATETEVFNEDFSTDLGNWTEEVGTVDGGVYTLPGNTINYVKDVELTNVAVSADVIIYNSEKPNGFMGGTTAYVTARADKDAGTGYDFGIGVNGSGQTYVRLYRRDPNGVSKILYQDTTAEGIGAIKTDTVYNIKIATTGNLIIGLINDVQVIQFEDTAFQSGGVGVRALDGEAQFDNVNVVEVPERRIESITIHTHSETISRVGKVYFTATVDYNSVYGTLEIDQDTEGVSISGLDCTTGNKTVTVKFQDGTATFPVEVVYSIPNRVIYETGFNTNDGTWNEAYTDFNNYGLKIGNGYAAAYASTNPVDAGVSDKTSRPDEELAGVGNYSLEMTAKIMSDIPTAQIRRGFASLQFAGVPGGGKYYEMRLTSNGNINVYLDSDMKYTASLTNVTGEAFEFGKTYTLRVDVFDEAAILYINGKQAGVYSDFEGGSFQPHAAVKAGNGTVLIDSFKSVAVEPKGDYAVTSIYAVTATDSTVVGNKVLHNFNPEYYLVMAKYADGSQIPFPLKDNMISWYDPTGEYDQVIRITYAGKSCYVNYHYLPYLFYDDFTAFANPEWNIDLGPNITYAVVSDRLRTTYDSKQKDSSSATFLCPDGEEWTDYSITLDVYFDQKGNENTKERYMNLICRRVGDDYYQMRLVLNANGVFSMVLARFVNGVYSEIKSVKATILSMALGEEEALGAGNLYSLRFDCVGNTLKCYFEGRMVLSYTDQTDNPYMKGTAGFVVINSNSIVDNFMVKTKNASYVTDVALSNYPDGNITVWQGNDLAIWENDLVLTYADGEVEEIPMTYDMIGPFANTELGKHSVDITYLGQTHTLEVTVLERPEYVADVAAQIEAFADTVDESNKAAFLELKALYDSLSPYEASNLSAELIEKHKKLLYAYDCLIAPELTGDVLAFNELFNDDSSLKYWGDSLEGSRGLWFLANGILYQAQTAYGRFGTSWRCPPLHGNITGISADIMCMSSMMHAGIGFNVGKDGYYHCRLSSTSLDEYSMPMWEFQFLRKGGSGHVKLTTINLEAYGYEIGPGDWFNLLLTLEDDTVNAYLNGELIFSHEETEELYSVGEAGVRISEADAIVDNIRVYGTEVPKEEQLVYYEPAYYSDDFEDETPGQNPSHWQETVIRYDNVDVWKVFEKDGNKVYGTTYDKLTGTWLHAFDDDTSFTVKFMAENMSELAKFGFITRMAPTTAYHIVGYDAFQQKWYSVSQDAVSSGFKTDYQEGTFVLEPGRWYEAELVLEDKNQVLKIDGVEVFVLDTVYHTAHGRMGFYTNGADFFVDDYDLKLGGGDIPQDGVYTYEVGPGNFMEIEELPDGDLFAIYGTNVLRSDDKGLTWANFTRDPAYSDLMLAGNYPTLLKMSNGEYLQIVHQEERMTLARVSRDMDNWENLGYVVPEERWTDSSGRFVAIFHINNATEVTLADGTHRIFFACAFRKHDSKGVVVGHHSEIYYSDDWGRTWNTSETTTKDIHPGWTYTNSTTWAESKVVSCADGTLRFYYPRNYLGCMQYSVSTDGGVTWSGLQQIPEIQLPMTSFAVYEDPENPGTWYMVCCDQTTASLGSIFPRDRFVLLRSYDGMNWEFLMNIERMFDHISIQNGERLYQLLDPSLYIDDNYVHITFGRSEYEFSETDAAAHQDQRVMYMRVEKDKLEGRPWDSSTIADMYYPKTIEFEVAPQTVFGLNDLFVCEGTLKLTDFLGNVTYEEIRKGARVYTEPDMFSLGTKTVELRYKNAYDLSYEIEVRPKAEILWTIEGEGTVDPKNRYIIEGTTQTITLTPAEGWKLSEVWLGEELIETPDNQFTISYDKQGYDILIVFTEVTIFDSPWFYVGVGGGLLIAVGAALFFILAAKKKKKATSQQPPEA